jgi:predicted PurR-regulated permease PerM
LLPWLVTGFAISGLIVFVPFWVSLVLAAWFAVLTRPLFLKLSRPFHGRHRAAAVMTVGVVVALLLPVTLLAVSLVGSVIELVQTVLQSESGKSALKTLVSKDGTEPGQAVPPAAFGVEQAIGIVRDYGERAWSLLKAVASAGLRVVLGFFIFICASYAFLADGPRIYSWLVAHAPVSPAHARRFGMAFVETGRGLFFGVGLTALAQGVTATIAYLALGIPRAVILGALTAVGSLIPSVGTALVWVPLTIGLFLTGMTVKAVVLLALGVFVIGTIDNVLKPVLSRRAKLKLPVIVVMLAMLGGIAVFGAWGLILGPLLVRLAVEALAIAREQGLVGSSALSPPARPEHST